MKNLKQKWNKILCVILLISLFPLQIFAAGATLSVRLGSEDGLVTSNIQVEVIRIGSQQGGELTVERAKDAYRIVLEEDWNGIVKRTNASGTARFSGLERGLYLVFERGGQKVTFAPYLVWIQGGLFTSEPKVEESGNRIFHVTKQWNDGNDADRIRPSSVEVFLLRDGEPYRKANLSSLNGWNHVFVNLPELGTYTVREVKVAGYRTSYEADNNSCIITNTHEFVSPEAIEVLVKVIWNDNENAAKRRPDHVTVQLLKNQILRRNLAVIKTASVSEDNRWMTSFAGLEEGNYSVLQYAVDGYTTTYSSEGPYSFVITNTLITPPGPGGGNPPGGGGETPGTTPPGISPPGITPPGGGLPDTPEGPDTPAEPEIPEEPDEPVEPDGPTIPQMGFITWPIYVLLICGVLMILGGSAVLMRGRREE